MYQGVIDSILLPLPNFQSSGWSLRNTQSFVCKGAQNIKAIVIGVRLLPLYKLVFGSISFFINHHRFINNTIMDHHNYMYYIFEVGTRFIDKKPLEQCSMKYMQVYICKSLINLIIHCIGSFLQQVLVFTLFQPLDNFLVNRLS